MEFKYYPLEGSETNRRKTAWEGLAKKQAFGRVAICINGRVPDFIEIEPHIIPADEIPLQLPAGKYPEWDFNIRNQLRNLQFNALSNYQDDTFPAISIPRHIHGQSQGLAEAFGCSLIPQDPQEGLYYPVPSIHSIKDIDNLKIKPTDEILYGRSIEFAEYARLVTDGQLSVRNPVMTGPIDTANYILGTMKLMEWIYDEPDTLHRLLFMITDNLISTIWKLQAAVEECLCPDHSFCITKGFALCSEIRSLISSEAYNEFEAPYLKQIGEACGPFMIHSCGTWERTLNSVLENTKIMMINFQIKEMDIQKIITITKGNLSMKIGRSINLGEKYTWKDAASFFRHVIKNLPEVVPLEMDINTDDINTFINVQSELHGGKSGMFKWRL